MDTLTVDIWSDLLCPWCHIGKRRFEKALAALPDRDAVRVRWRSFELDPGLGREPGMTLPERHRRDVAGTAAQAARNMATLTDLAAAEGLTYRLDEALAVNSFDAHRLTHYGEHAGHGEAVRERLMRAYTAEGAVISDADTLVRLGVEAGLDEAGTREVVQGSAFADAVRADEAEAVRLGVRGVPTFVFAGRYAASGAQPVEAFAELFARARRG